jgi:hypothetical protein
MNWLRLVAARKPRRRAGWLGMMLLMLCAGTAAHAQKSTEQFIPIGKSPGISEKVTAIGTLVTVKPLEHTFMVSEPGGRRTVRMTGQTLIWLDRSGLKLPNLVGSYADIQPGRRVEVKFTDPIRRDVAEWIKVEVTK